MMSRAEIKNFNTWLIANDEARATVEGYGSDLEKMVAFARKSGFDIDLDDVKKIMSEDVELDIDSLENISGGTRAGILGQIVSTVGVAFLISENN